MISLYYRIHKDVFVKFIKLILVIILISFSIPSSVRPGEVVIKNNFELDSDAKKCWFQDSYKSILECIHNLCTEYKSVPDAAMKRIECSKVELTLRSLFSSTENQPKISCKVLASTNSQEINNPREVEEKCINDISDKLPLIQKKCLEEVQVSQITDINQVNSCVRNASQQYVENFITSNKSWYKDADTGGDPDTLVKAADNLYISQKYSEAFGFYLRAAESGNTDAQLKVAEMYREGRGVEKNIVQSLNWYQKAADRGSWEARIKIHEIESTN